MTHRRTGRELERILVHRFEESEMVIKCGNGQEIIVEPGCGGLQGDDSMPEMFIATYDRQLNMWIGTRRKKT